MKNVFLFYLTQDYPEGSGEIKKKKADQTWTRLLASSWGNQTDSKDLPTQLALLVLPK